MMKNIFCLAFLAGLVSGCAPTLNYSEINQNIANFHPKSAVILPFVNSVGMDSANDYTGLTLVNTLNTAGLFQKIIGPEQVKAMMVQYPSVIEAITRFRTTWLATGTIDPKLVGWIGKAFNVDTVVFGEVSTWTKLTGNSHYFYQAGVAMRWVDASSGQALWKMSHVGMTMSGFICIFDCSSIEKTMDQTMDLVVKSWPVAGK